ncbi:MAG: benzoate transporter [Alphaproteobacteria bacterium]|nr:benzoate transporter [Alphaproteobacteria bacterium]
MPEPHGRQPPSRLAEIAAGLNRHNLTNGATAFLFATTGPAAIYLAALAEGEFSRAETISILSAVYGIPAVLSIAFCAAFRQPMAVGWTLPGAVLLGPALQHLPFAEVVGACLTCGALLAGLGASGLIGRVMRQLPAPIVMGMVAAVFVPMVVRMVSAMGEAGGLALAMLSGFIGIAVQPRLSLLFPPVLAAIAAGAAFIAVEGRVTVGGFEGGMIAAPAFFMPAFSVRAMVELVLPLTLTVIGAQNAQGFYVLRLAGFRDLQNRMTTLCGLGTFPMALLGSVPLCVTGPTNAIVSSSGPKELRYVGGIVYAVLVLLFALFAPVGVGLALALPPAFIALLGGLAMLSVVQGAFIAAFAGKFPLGALVSFVVTLSGISIFGIGAAFWGLVFGYAASRLLEREQFHAFSAA